ncbi:uncharacterized protein LOC107644914 isoform X1 [Arachis ipaensis]|uniref:uncharacterized protein LOC107644914 isoform X1 n=1 Tax=Arachis ipaensis TaxID=130454 RepID=UPI000A2B87EA|nr:uncharacterized protein LOC107644914 isoform X1 [Arachis ipaensis]XP_020958941.1 uncharacterized protein LOC107644914 isoform X1 [Arachis ipaensis]
MVILTTITTSTRQLLFGAEQQCLFFIFFLHLTQRSGSCTLQGAMACVCRSSCYSSKRRRKSFLFPSGTHRTVAYEIRRRHQQIRWLTNTCLCTIFLPRSFVESLTCSSRRSPTRMRCLPRLPCLVLENYGISFLCFAFFGFDFECCDGSKMRTRSTKSLHCHHGVVFSPALCVCI